MTRVATDMQMNNSLSRAARAANAKQLAGLMTPALALLLLLSGAGCSIERMAVNRIGDALAGSGSTFASDDDPELIRAAAPFSLKLMESLLAESPRHQGLLLASASGFTQYAYAFVQQDADELEMTDFASAEILRDRARRLYLRARDYGLRALETSHRGLVDALYADPRSALSRTRVRDVPMLYWTALAWGATIAVSKDDPHRVAELPQMEALIDRALELDEDYDHGAIHTFLITYEMSREDAPGAPADRARYHFARALELSQGRLVSPWVALAESVSLQEQRVDEFDRLLGEALALDPDAHPEFRLMNLIMQRRARWLLSQREDLFLIPPDPQGQAEIGEGNERIQ
jgi:predicted anti-sigma-YlaC factor YlaD